jgi:hypothetical protein
VRDSARLRTKRSLAGRAAGVAVVLLLAGVSAPAFGASGRPAAAPTNVTIGSKDYPAVGSGYTSTRTVGSKPGALFVWAASSGAGVNHFD